MIAEGGIYIEDYSDIEQQVAEIAHVDLIEQELLDKPRDQVIIHMYLEPGASPVETLALIAARMEAAGIPYTAETEAAWSRRTGRTAGANITTPWTSASTWPSCPPGRNMTPTVSSSSWIPAWPLAPAATRPPASAWKRWTSGSRAASGCWICGTGSGILAIAALKLGAASAEGVDIDPVAVRTAGENAALNGVADKLTVLVGDLSDKASGKYDIITANIVANAIMSLAPAVPGLMADNGVFIASGIIDSRKDEVLAALKAAGLAVQEVKEKRGWECIICKK